MLNLIDTASDKTKAMAAGAIALTMVTFISYHIDKKKAKKTEEENEYPEEDVFDPLLDEEDEA